MLKRFIKRYGGYLCSILILIGTITVNDCKIKWYQPVEPDGFSDFIKKR